MDEVVAGVFLDEDEQRRLNNFIADLDCFLSEALPAGLGNLYDIFRRLQNHEGGWTPEAKVDFLNECAEAKELTGLPYSLEEENAGLSSSEAWDEAILAAYLRAKDINKALTAKLLVDDPTS